MSSLLLVGYILMDDNATDILTEMSIVSRTPKKSDHESIFIQKSANKDSENASSLISDSLVGSLGSQSPLVTKIGKYDKSSKMNPSSKIDSYVNKIDRKIGLTNTSRLDVYKDDLKDPGLRIDISQDNILGNNVYRNSILKIKNDRDILDNSSLEKLDLASSKVSIDKKMHSNKQVEISIIPLRLSLIDCKTCFPKEFFGRIQSITLQVNKGNKKMSKFIFQAALGAVSQSISGNENYLTNAKNHETSYFSSLSSLTYQNTIRVRWYYNVGLSYLQHVHNFQFSGTRTDQIAQNGVVEILETQNGIINIEGEVLTSKTYLVTKDILNYKSNVSLVAGVGYRYSFNDRWNIGMSIDYYHNVLGSYNGQILYQGDQVSNISSLETIYDRLRNNQLSMSAEANYQITSEWHIGIRLTAIKDINSMSSVFDHKYRAYLVGAIVGYKF